MTTAAAASVDTLRHVPLFAVCSDETLSDIAGSLETVRVRAGETLFPEGDRSTELFIVADGDLRVVSDVATEKVVFAHLGPGDFVGEMALLLGDPRSAGVIASTDATLWRLAQGDFERAQAKDPAMVNAINGMLSKRLRQGNAHRYQNEAFTLVALTPERPELTIGRLAENDVVLNDPQVDAVHARLKNVDGRWTIVDESSQRTTFVNRMRVESAVLSDGDEILVGTNRVYLDGLRLRAFEGQNGVRIEAVDLSKQVAKGRTILNNVTLCIQPGELVAVVGSSGAGKSTLLHALNGFSPASTGRVAYNGLDLYQHMPLFRSVLGYVPQDDIVHPELTVERTLFYAGKLRLPQDTLPAELAERIDEVLDAVGMSEHRRTEIRSLSGGQRKRVSIATELLSRPRALYLDEPTSGLDPALERRMMHLFRSLTEQGATIVVTTHATQSLLLCDKVIWMAPGGNLVFFGSPAEALRHFGVREIEEIYESLDSTEECERWATQFKQSRAYQVNVVNRLGVSSDGAAGGVSTAGVNDVSSGPRGLRQFFWLSMRYLDILSRDRLNLALLLVQAPLIGLAALILFSPSVFAPTLEQGGDAFRALMALHVITASAIFLGATNAAREITKEANVYKRERLVNLDVVPYVMSKFVVLAVICMLQAPLLLGVFMARIDIPGSDWAGYWQLLGAIYLTEIAGLSMGLLISAVSANPDRAMALVPIALIPQLIFAGALVPVPRMLLPAEAVSQVMISKWALQLTGGLTDLSERFVAQFPAAYAQPYADQLDAAHWVSWVVLAAFSIGMLALTILAQRLKDTR